MGLRTPAGTGDTPGRPGHDRQEAGLMAGFDELKRNINDTSGMARRMRVSVEY